MAPAPLDKPVQPNQISIHGKDNKIRQPIQRQTFEA
jgi:hypothetical protein